MDVSKLPRLSQTTAPPPADPSPNPSATVGAGFPVVPVASSVQQLFCNNCGAANAPNSRFCGGCGSELAPTATRYAAAPIEGPGIGAEVWLSAIIGIVLMLFGLTFAKWALTTAFGGTYSTGLVWLAPIEGQPNQHPEGAPITYWELNDGVTALQDMAIFLFGLAMVLEAAVLAVIHSRVRSKRPLLVVAILVTLMATALNLVVAGKLIALNVIPLLSLLAVGFGGYIAAYEWRLYRYFQTPPKAA
jgi:hypothetical protein